MMLTLQIAGGVFAGVVAAFLTLCGIASVYLWVENARQRPSGRRWRS